ncbi:TPA: Flp pilus assembly complex ATPase component TadA [Escherichia coli]|nr:Flp pilus assembly complex ATPase component TadA [Escherichia coli]
MTAALRSDPDIIMPGEARDAEVINLLFTAAMTGHQVWTSLHANNAIAIFDRLKDQGVDDFKLTDPELITGLIAQRLVKKLCSECSLSLVDYLESGGILSEDEKIVIEGYGDKVRFANTHGCSSCKSGYKGRTIIAEVIEPDSYLLKLIAEGKRQEAISYWLNDLKGLSMKEHAWIKVLYGDITAADAMDRIAGMTDITQERKRFLFSLGR